MEGAKQMMDGNKMIMDIMTKKGIKDADLMAAEKMMEEGYNMVTKGESMMTGANPEGQKMVKEGAKMMLDAQKKTTAVVEKHEMVKECSIALDSCTLAKKR